MKLNVTPDEAWEIEEKRLECERPYGRAFNEQKWVSWMAERFQVSPGQYEMVIHWDRLVIPCDDMARVTE